MNCGEETAIGVCLSTDPNLVGVWHAPRIYLRAKCTKNAKIGDCIELKGPACVEIP